MADLPRSETPAKPVAPSETTVPDASTDAPTAGVANATVANAGVSRPHGPTSLLLPSNRRPTPEQSAANSEVCRSYTATKTLLGQPRQVNGLACRDGKGGWQIITELTN